MDDARTVRMYDPRDVRDFILIICTCGTPLKLEKRDPDAILSGTFCPTCDKQWWTRWKIGVLVQGDITPFEKTYSEEVAELHKAWKKFVKAVRDALPFGKEKH